MRLKGCRQEEWLEGCGAARSGRRGVGRVELFGFGAGDDRTANSAAGSGGEWGTDAPNSDDVVAAEAEETGLRA